MKTFIAQSTNIDPKQAVAELKSQFNSAQIKAVTFFASTIYNPAELIAAMNENFPNIHVWGCSTCGEIIGGTRSLNSIVAMAFTDEIIEDIAIQVIDNESKNISEEIFLTVKALEKYYNSPITKLDNKKYFGLLYFNGISYKEEIILDELGNYSNLFLIGGSAADDLAHDKVVNYANGKHFTNSTVLALIKSKVKIGFEKLQSFEPTEHIVVATKIDQETNTIFELNGKPATETYCELLKIPRNEMENSFSDYALGLVIEGQPFLRAIIDREVELGFGVGAKTQEGMQFTIMKSVDLIENTRNTLAKIKSQHKTIAGVLAFDCCYRYIAAMGMNVLSEYAELFGGLPLIGFHTYGETYLGQLNHSLIMLVFEEQA